MLCSYALPSVGEAARLVEDVGRECTLDSQGEILAAFDLGEGIKPHPAAGLQQLHLLHWHRFRHMHVQQPVPPWHSFSTWIQAGRLSVTEFYCGLFRYLWAIDRQQLHQEANR